jgi:uncharacterized protein (DUF433 family)
MELTSFFTFLGPDDIRIKGSRIGIQSVLYEHIFRSRTPEQIAERYPSLRLEHVYATILYYLVERERLDAYMASWLAREEAMLAAQANDPAFQAFQERLRQGHGGQAASAPASVGPASPR